MNKSIPKTKEAAEQRIREILAKHPLFQGAEVTVNFKDKKQNGRNHGKRSPR